MKEFHQLLQNYMDVNEHTPAMIADALSVSEDDIKLYCTGAVVPNKSFMTQVSELYHLDAVSGSEFKRAWEQSKIKSLELSNKKTRKDNAAKALLDILSADCTTLNDKILFVLVASQFYFNAAFHPDTSSTLGKRLIDMRNTLVYDFGSDACASVIDEIQSADMSAWYAEVGTEVGYHIDQ